ncbi:MAG: hypothetical protein JXR87_01205 [Candidatus Marinimicrobia bacterium]|nr:hypothetical protein [Candidatus Neomarinimicrobiota bacterium]
MTIGSRIKVGLLCVLVLTFRCSIYEETVPNAESIIPIAWDFFESGEYQTAYVKFDAAIEADSRNSDAYHGRAWSSLLLSDVSDAIRDFNAAVYYGNSSLDPIAGLAIAYQANQQFSSAISKSQTVLSSNSNYYFEHKPLINFRDLHLILAMAYFHTGNLTQSYNQIIILESEISIAQNDSSTWKYNDQSYQSYAETLMAIIDYLDVLYGM